LVLSELESKLAQAIAQIFVESFSGWESLHTQTPSTLFELASPEAQLASQFPSAFLSGVSTAQGSLHDTTVATVTGSLPVGHSQAPVS
jgi:hypothetical protein